jgi:hypothetical protein
VSIEATITTEALLKFVVDHKHHNLKCIHLIEACAVSLRKNEIVEAVSQYDKFMSSCGVGRMGCFDDGGITIAYEHESIDYIYEVFGALLGRWSSRMASLKSRTS